MSFIKNHHKGETIFVVGCGPSLNKENLDLLQDQTVVFCNNSIIACGAKTRYQVITDHSRVKECVENSEVIDGWISAPRELRLHHPVYYKNAIKLTPQLLPLFSYDLTEFIGVQKSVILPAMQIALWLGAANIVLLGVDYHYGDIKWFDGDAPHRHFYPLRWEEDRHLFSESREAIEKVGSRLWNATCETRVDNVARITLKTAVQLSSRRRTSKKNR